MTPRIITLRASTELSDARPFSSPRASGIRVPSNESYKEDNKRAASLLADRRSK